MGGDEKPTKINGRGLQGRDAGSRHSPSSMPFIFVFTPLSKMVYNQPMIIRRAYKFRFYPNQEQRIQLAQTFGCKGSVLAIPNTRGNIRRN
ncbi:MAG TPA: helix-turn-helix domain-containing protein [Xenococcaceae cyanobacterium]